MQTGRLEGSMLQIGAPAVGNARTKSARETTVSMKRRILLVDDEVAVLLTLKAVLEISGFDVDTATSAREGKARIKHREYEMVITDMRMEGERAGEEVINAAKAASYNPAVALLSAFPVDEDALADMGADKVLVKPMHTRQLLQQLEALYVRHHGNAEAATDEPTGDAAPAKTKAAKSTVKADAKPVKETGNAGVKASSVAAKKPVARAAAKTAGKPAGKTMANAAAKPVAKGARNTAAV
jgi:CheY-like chemotaxis protein